MTLLGQQQLMEPASRRRVIVPHGCERHAGVDPSTKRLSIAWICADGTRDVATDSIPDLQGAARLDAIYHVARSLAVAVPVPGLAYVEQPGGEKRNYPLFYAVGATLAGLHAGWGPRVYIEITTPAHWKKVACGRGNIYKPTKKKLGRTPVFEDYGVAVWARENGYTGDLWDEADALGLAEAARREVLLEVR